MPAAANIVLADAQAAPVSHTFIPIGRDANDVFWFEDQSASNSVGFWRISVQIKRPAPSTNGTQATRTFRKVIGLHEPVLETLSNNAAGLTPAPTVAYVSRAVCEFIDPERSKLLDRQNMTKMVPLLLQNTLMVDILNNNTQLSY